MSVPLPLKGKAPLGAVTAVFQEKKAVRHRNIEYQPLPK
jgi:hypothetical protein